MYASTHRRNTLNETSMIYQCGNVFFRRSGDKTRCLYCILNVYHVLSYMKSEYVNQSIENYQSSGKINQ